MMRHKIHLLAVVGLLASAFSAVPAQASTPTGTLGTLSFSSTGTTLSGVSVSKLRGWTSTLKQATAVTVQGFGGTTAVSKSKACALGLARAQAVKSWLATNKAGGTVTVMNKCHASSAGSDQGNRVVVIITKRNITVTVTSDYDAPPQGQAAVCNFAVTSVNAKQGTTQVASASTSTAAGTCSRTFTLKAVPTAKATSLVVSFTCNESGDYMPAEDVCAYVTAVAPWSVVPPEIGATAGTGSLTGVTVGATTGSVAAAALKVNPN